MNGVVLAVASIGLSMFALGFGLRGIVGPNGQSGADVAHALASIKATCTSSQWLVVKDVTKNQLIINCEEKGQ